MARRAMSALPSIAKLSALALMGLRQVFALVRDQSPLEQVKRTLARLMVLPNDEELLARSSIVARGNIDHPAVADTLRL